MPETSLPLVPPNLHGEEVNVSVVAQEPVVLECQSHAEPPPELSWWKDGRPLLPRPGVRLSADQAVLEVGRPGDPSARKGGGV